MATIKELSISRRQISSDNPSHERRYVVFGTDSPDAAMQLFFDNEPEVVGNLFLNRLEVEPEEQDETIWNVTAEYTQEPSPDSDIGVTDTGSTTSFTVGTKEVNIRQGKVNSYQAFAREGETPRNFLGGINYNGESGFEGVEVKYPTFTQVERRQIPANVVNGLPFRETLYSKAGHVNSDTVLGIAAGQVLFVGATGELDPKTGVYNVSYEFSVSPNQTNVVVAGISVGTVGGWEYLWAHYEKRKDNDWTTPLPLAIYKHKLYPETTLANIIWNP